MILTPNIFTLEYLSGLKFKELQKLSVQFHVNKRWAKKQELIENLLALKRKDETFTDNNQDDGKEWRDGSTVFNDIQQNENEINRRLTFNVDTKSSVEHTDPHLTFEVSQNGKNLLGEKFNSRETYDTSPSILDLSVEPLKESRATFEIPPKQKLVNDVDPRATFDVPQNGKKLLDETEMVSNEGNVKKSKRNSDASKVGDGLKQNLGNVKFDVRIKDEGEEKGTKGKLQVKTLTIPYARVTRRTRKDGEASKTVDSPIKMSKKSINIKKSTRLPISKSNLIKSPPFSSVKSSVNKQTIIQTLTKPEAGKVTQSKVPVRLNFNNAKPPEKSDDSNKENARKILRKRISKTVDETIMGKKSNVVKVNFRTPPPSMGKSSKAMPLKKTPLRKEVDARLNKSAGVLSAVKSTTKPITATKMPDFSKIHKRQFEQMDSLHDYLKKKEDRIRKLFGTPQPGQQMVQNKSASVFRFQSTTADKENKGGDALQGLVTPLKKKENDTKAVQKEAFKSKLPPLKLRSEIKDKNRSHIHGVRTNKRFELQMKFRNM